MYNVCRRITNNEDDAQDVLQDVFLKAFQNLGQFEGKSTFGAWLKRIAVNESIAHLRKKKFKIEELGPEEEFEEQVDHFPETLQQVEMIKKAMKDLPDGYRIIFSLYLLEGYDHGEISQILNISESTSKSQLNRAKNKLREILEKEVMQ
jgi:RNA polymerase sigma-70 factor (ECF subfamily)